MTKRVVEQPQPLARPSRQPQQALPDRVYSAGYGFVIRPNAQASNPDDEEEAASKKKKHAYIIIETGLLIPGDGAPVHDAVLVIEGETIVWVGTQGQVPEQYTSAAHRTFRVPYAMPGLWDVHVHFGGEAADDDDMGSNTGIFLQHAATAGARLARGCWETLQRGYTSVRDLAGYGAEVARAGTVGPHIYSAGAALSQTAGHGDLFELPAGDVLRKFGVRGGDGGAAALALLVDGVDECRRAVRLNLRRGARCIKVCASGGVGSRDDDPLRAQFGADELAVVVEEAARQGRAVAAHAHGKPGILAAVAAGVASVEHASMADEECIERMREKGTVFVATRTVNHLLLRSGGRGLTRYQWEKAQLVAEHNLEAYKLAIKAGLPIALGTDTSPGFNMAMELEFAVQAGMSNLEAIKAATANGPLTVGEQAPKTGQLKVGYEADILGLLANPVEDVKVLQDIQTIGWVWKSGKLFKGPGVGPWGEDP